jgi:L-ascorbate metabolism protein UlaG (beta-lactamase superfamily)
VDGQLIRDTARGWLMTMRRRWLKGLGSCPVGLWRTSPGSGHAWEVTTTRLTQNGSQSTSAAGAQLATAPRVPVDIRLVGGPTALLEVAGLRILTDPTFDPPGDHPFGSRKLVKTTFPAVSAAEIGAIDVVLLSRDQHPDNLDDAGRKLLEHVPLVLTTEDGAHRLSGTARPLRAWGHEVLQLPDGQLTVYGVPAQHGPDNTEHLPGRVRGFVLASEGMPTVYVSGDNVSLRVVQEIADPCRSD